MKDYAWKLAERYPNHEKHMSLRDGVEMEVEGHGDRWAWNVRSTTGAYIAKDGKAESLREAKAKAEGAANGVRSLSKNAIESNLVERVMAAMADEFKQSSALPSYLWTKTKISELGGRAKNEAQLIQMIVESRRKMVSRVRSR